MSDIRVSKMLDIHYAINIMIALPPHSFRQCTEIDNFLFNLNQKISKPVWKCQMKFYEKLQNKEAKKKKKKNVENSEFDKSPNEWRFFWKNDIFRWQYVDVMHGATEYEKPLGKLR